MSNFLKTLQKQNENLEPQTVGSNRSKVAGSPDDILLQIVKLSDELMSRNIDSVMKSIDSKRDSQSFEFELGRIKKLYKLLKGNSRHVK